MRDKTKYYPNSYQTPNVLIDEHLKELDPIEFTLLSIVIRKTMGWHKESDYISLSQIMKIAPKISRPSIIRKMASLENDHGLIIVNRNSGRPNEYRLSDLFFNKVVSQGYHLDNEVVSQGYQAGITEIPVASKSSISVIHTKPNNKPTNKTQKERSPQNGLRDVQIYFIESGIDDPLSNALKFYSHYEACGWVQGNRGKPLKNWRAAPWASWNFKKTYSQLAVRLIDQERNCIIEKFPRDRIIKGLESGKLRIEDDLYFVADYIRQERTKENTSVQSPSETKVREKIQKSLLGPSSHV